MSVIAAYTYKGGKRSRPIDIFAESDLKLADGEFAWIGLYEPTEDELAGLVAQLPIGIVAIDDEREIVAANEAAHRRLARPDGTRMRGTHT